MEWEVSGLDALTVTLPGWRSFRASSIQGICSGLKCWRLPQADVLLLPSETIKALGSEICDVQVFV